VPPVDEIRQRLRENLGRVESIIASAEQLPTGAATPIKTDLLRAAVVFLHATLEDVLRSGLELELPRAAAEHLIGLQFLVGKKTPDKISMPELAAHRGKTVDELIRESVERYLERSNFNNIPEILNALEGMGIDPNEVATAYPSYKDDLNALMERRHWIVHRVDRNRQPPGRGISKSRFISKKMVDYWTNTVRDVGGLVLTKLEEKP